ncbi:B3 domain-containing protein Os01g0234100-like [Solanum tuberosum]|uniref:B3 domain-containing protein Os01g0234100-like n=1 Tax=Solanum tuberosum TaxID=4113 RepID=UPI000739FB40|nr:PREDICTED: B3 domain-containing protein Os01g0234100-like [Solanum tuberosum]
MDSWNEWVEQTLEKLESRKLLRSLRPIHLSDDNSHTDEFECFDGLRQWDRASVEVEILETTFQKWLQDIPSPGDDLGGSGVAYTEAGSSLAELKNKEKKALQIKKKALPPSKTNKVVNGGKKKVQLCLEKKAQKSSVDVNSFAMLRAAEVQANLPCQFPSFVKYMLPSHVSGGFWLGFPKKFCDCHLPKHDDIVVLVDENDEESPTKYLVDKNGLSRGWRGFSIAHNLLEGDVLVFQLIQPSKFKVFIIRENCLTEIDGAITLLNLDSRARPIKSDHDEEMKICEAKEEKYLEPPILDINQDDNIEEAMLLPNSDNNPVADQCGNDSDNGSEVLEGIRFSESRVEFMDVKDYSGFSILVDGLIIDSEVPTLHIRTKYYDLCRTQNSFLHDHLLGGLNVKLAAGMITETVNIADAIRACKISTPRDCLETWDNTLKGFECLGMNVGFYAQG